VREVDRLGAGLQELLPGALHRASHGALGFATAVSTIVCSIGRGQKPSSRRALSLALLTHPAG
jgi:hypothetical protein